jgi:hypothetical protein
MQRSPCYAQRARAAVLVACTWLAPLAATAVLLPACTTYAEDLNRGERHFQANEYERALALFRVIEPDMDSLSPVDRTRYAYLRGMTDYRMSYRADARHWLGLARAMEKQTPGGIEESWKDRLNQALTDLDGDVFGGAEGTSDSAGADGGAAKPGAK